MTSVDKVKSLCKERKIPISRLEKDLGYGNGYIGQLRKGTFPNDRLVEIANYLNVPTSYLTGEELNNMPAPVVQSEHDKTLEQLLNLAATLDSKDLEILTDMAKAIKERREKRD